MDFMTGSVVVPFTSETTASSWPVTALTTLDLPTLRQPKKPMWTRSAAGVSFIPMAGSLLVACPCGRRCLGRGAAGRGLPPRSVPLIMLARSAFIF